MKKYWWVSVGGNDCEPAIVTAQGEIFTFGCPDAHPRENIELVQELPVRPDTPAQAEQKAAAWEKQREADRKRGIIHGYRTFQ